jgi:hypothetical protein
MTLQRPPICSTKGCHNQARGRGLCGKCYMRSYREGVLPPSPLPLAHLIGRCRKEGNCLIFQGSLMSQGYGIVTFQGTTQLAHRLHWTLANGTIPKGHYICRRDICRNRACISLDHLFLAKNKNLKHTEEGIVLKAGPKLTEKDVKLMKEIFRENPKELNRDVAAEFDVSEQTISEIRRGKTWSTA